MPILVGAVVENADGTNRNTSIVWDPETGPGATHDKRQLVPFGEYLPLRPLMTKLSPYASMVGFFVSGTGNGTVVANGIPIAVATCYEVAFDALVADSVRAGAQLITVPTNNAAFGFTDMSYQQLAMSRVRAVEHNRSAVVAATSGVNAVISPDGTVFGQTELFTAGTLVARVPGSLRCTARPRAGRGGAARSRVHHRCAVPVPKPDSRPLLLICVVLYGYADRGRARLGGRVNTRGRVVVCRLLAAALIAAAAGCSTGTGAVTQRGSFDFVSPGGRTDILYDQPDLRGRPGALRAESDRSGQHPHRRH